jgi:CDP-diacylglycerol--glycerol-3-phosphate 3-phosphatidyltransferase
MSTSREQTQSLAHGGSLMSSRVKDRARAILAPVVRMALRLHVTPNTVTVMGFFIVVVAAAVIGVGDLIVGALILTAGSLLDAVDGALARATGGGTAFGSFLDSTLDRAAEAILYAGVAAYFLGQPAPTWPVIGAFMALAGSFMVSYARARAEGIGLTAAIGLAPRPERIVLIVAGLLLAGFGFHIALIAILWLIGVLTVATTAQRIWHVWRITSSQG